MNHIILGLAAACLLVGCSDKVSFSSLPSTVPEPGKVSEPSPDPDIPVIDPDLPVTPLPPAEPPVVVTPPVIVPPVVVSPPVAVEPPVIAPPVLPPVSPPVVIVAPPITPEDPPLKEGEINCNDHSQDKSEATSCLKCPESKKPELSGKALKLLEIMSVACQVPNKSEPKGYKPPTREQIEMRLAACTEELYPETVYTEAEQNVIVPLLNENSELYKRMFGHLWYSGHLSDAYDHYFGLGVDEAVQLFCHNTKPTLTGELWSREMWDWFYKEDLWRWPTELQNLHKYYQHVRSGLVKCLDKQSSNNIIQNKSKNQMKCETKLYTGKNHKDVTKKVQDLLKKGFTVSVEDEVSCQIVNSASSEFKSGQNYKVFGIKCN